jgi:hypothetical protein
LPFPLLILFSAPSLWSFFKYYSVCWPVFSQRATPYLRRSVPFLAVSTASHTSIRPREARRKFHIYLIYKEAYVTCIVVQKTNLSCWFR